MSFGNIFIIIMTFFAQFIFIGSIWLLTLSVLLPSGVLWNKQKRKKNQAQKHDFVILCVFPAENTGLLISLLKCFRIIIYSIVESKANVFSIKKKYEKEMVFLPFLRHCISFAPSMISKRYRCRTEIWISVFVVCLFGCYFWNKKWKQTYESDNNHVNWMSFRFAWNSFISP